MAETKLQCAGCKTKLIIPVGSVMTARRRAADMGWARESDPTEIRKTRDVCKRCKKKSWRERNPEKYRESQRKTMRRRRKEGMA